MMDVQGIIFSISSSLSVHLITQIYPRKKFPRNVGRNSSSTRPSWRCSQFSHKSKSSLVVSADRILRKRSFGCPAAREAHPAERRENCWPASWRGSNYSNDSGRLRFPSSSFFSSSSSSAQKRFNCRNRFTAKMRLRAVMLASHNRFLISDTIFQDSYQIFLFRLLSFRLSQSYCCFGVLIG